MQSCDCTRNITWIMGRKDKCINITEKRKRYHSACVVFLRTLDVSFQSQPHNPIHFQQARVRVSQNRSEWDWNFSSAKAEWLRNFGPDLMILPYEALTTRPLHPCKVVGKTKDERRKGRRKDGGIATEWTSGIPSNKEIALVYDQQLYFQ